MALLDRSGRALQDASDRADAGDEDFGWVMSQVSAGKLLTATLHVTVYFQDAHGDVQSVDCVNRGVWLERGPVPAVERRVSELSAKDFQSLAQKLNERGVALDAAELYDMFVHVILDESLVAELVSADVAQ